MTVHWLHAFVLTVVIEAAIVIPMLRESEPSFLRRGAMVFFANLASHPAVWFVFPALGASYALRTWSSEAWAVLIEAALYMLVLPRAPRSRLVGVTCIANGASWGAGVLLRAVGGWLL